MQSVQHYTDQRRYGSIQSQGLRGVLPTPSRREYPVGLLFDRNINRENLEDDLAVGGCTCVPVNSDGGCLCTKRPCILDSVVDFLQVPRDVLGYVLREHNRVLRDGPFPPEAPRHNDREIAKGEDDVGLERHSRRGDDIHPPNLSVLQGGHPGSDTNRSVRAFTSSIHATDRAHGWGGAEIVESWFHAVVDEVEQVDGLLVRDEV